jgi:hypothetical protein
VVNKGKKEIQIVNSLASVPQFRDESLEITLVSHHPSYITFTTSISHTTLLVTDYAIDKEHPSMYGARS